MSQRNLKVGAGFPARVKTLLMDRRLRPADLQKAGIMSSVTFLNWTKGKCYPDEWMFFQFAKHLKLTTGQARTLLRLNPGEPLLVTPTERDRVMANAMHVLDRIPDLLEECTQTETLEIHCRLLAGNRAVRKRLRVCIQEQPPDPPTPNK